MAAWVLAHPPWQALSRVRSRWDILVKSGPWTSKQFFSTASISTETPAMRQVKAYPYPDAAPDTSLFEDSTDEYREASGDTDAQLSTFETSSADSNHPSNLLKSLVKQGRFQDASRVHTELTNMGVEILPHPVYHFAARQALRDHALSREQRVAIFMKWWSLFPSRTEVDGARSVYSIVAELLRNSTTLDILLVKQFAVLAATKGHVSIASEVIPVVARYTSPEAAFGFLEDFCRAALGFKASLAKQGEHHDAGHDNKSIFYVDTRNWYSLLISELAATQRSFAALDILRLARARRIPISPAAYTALGREFFRDVNQDALKATVRLARAQLDGTSPTDHHQALSAAIQSLEGLRDPSLSPSPKEAQNLPLSQRSGLSTDELEHLRTADLSNSLTLPGLTRLLKRSIKAGVLDISATRLSKLVGALLQAKRTSLVRRLRASAYRHPQLVPLWALAEMTRLENVGFSLLHILREFEAHFHVVGVPRGIADEVWENPRTIQPGHLGPDRPPISRKLHPKPFDIHLVWMAALRRASSSSQVQRLYSQFLQDVAASRDVPPSTVPFLSSRPSDQAPNTPANSRVVPPPSLFNATHFALFIRAFQRFDLPSIARRVLLDMYHLGVKPNYVTLNAFIASLSAVPKDVPLSRIVDRLEELINTRSPSLGQPLLPAESLPPTLRRHNHDAFISARAQALKRNTLVHIYTGALARLLLDGRSAEPDTAEIARRFKERVPYRPGRNPFTDAVLRAPDIVNAISAEPATSAET
ncbi:hypothetical protein C8Q70DRAFT_304237 [Cubamyces menziesii]|uniref:Pentatricopeptide repeat domain-containing protein n=1 Tax=Trametes cubensis TaxID=1111947 RepID=A0AAD7XH65_9APHY|nr:hypothetical protein C8Q70DRAFT_304237 [Cubamyces menziesii]KAJ8502287.1 hypothetical protein ONZ51_g94 [Trametes cubensis]